MPTTRRVEGIATITKTGKGRRRETEDPPEVVHNEGAGGKYRATGEDAEDSAANCDKGSGNNTMETGGGETAGGAREVGMTLAATQETLE